jgi:hypothetical protein
MNNTIVLQEATPLQLTSPGKYLCLLLYHSFVFTIESIFSLSLEMGSGTSNQLVVADQSAYAIPTESIPNVSTMNQSSKMEKRKQRKSVEPFWVTNNVLLRQPTVYSDRGSRGGYSGGYTESDLTLVCSLA